MACSKVRKGVSTSLTLYIEIVDMYIEEGMGRLHP